MGKPRNALEIFQLLEKSNCKECGEKTCLAFAGAVFLGQKKLHECPKLAREVVVQFNGESVDHNADENIPDDSLKKMKAEIARIDLAAAAERIGAHFSDNKLTLKVLGKDFSVDTEGNLSSEIHINQWVAVPFLSYILYGQGLWISGKWLSFRELTGGQQRYPFFQKRCEEPMKRVADAYSDLFDDVVHMFSGKKVERKFQSDISVVLHPLPKVPIMICYWSPEEGMDSSLHVFFDETADRNLDVGAVFTLGTGLAEMFMKIVHRHGFIDTISSP